MNAKWSRLNSNEHYKTLTWGNRLFGWVVLIDGAWIARTVDGSVRADFDTMEEAQQFLTTIVSAGENDE